MTNAWSILALHLLVHNPKSLLQIGLFFIISICDKSVTVLVEISSAKPTIQAYVSNIIHVGIDWKK